MRPDVNSNRASGEHSHLRRLDESDTPRGGGRTSARSETAYLDPTREADAEILALLASFLLLPAELLVTGNLERLFHRLLVRTRVVNETEVTGVREIRDEVLASHRGRVDLQLVGQQVDHPLAEMGCLGAACTAIGIGRYTVCEHTDRTGRDVLPVVSTSRQQARIGLKSAERAHVAADIHVLRDLEEDQGAVLLGAGFDVEDHAPAVRRGLERLGSRLDPFDRVPA